MAPPKSSSRRPVGQGGKSSTASKKRSAPVVVHQLDEISRAIGRVDAYVHEFRHGTNNLEQLIKAGELSSEKRHATLRVELSAQMEKGLKDLDTKLTSGLSAMQQQLAGIDGRVAALERSKERQDGAIGVWKWLAAHWPFAALAAFLSFLIAWANGKLPHL